MLKMPEAPLSRSILVAVARSRLYVGVFTWSDGTLIASPAESLRASW